MRKLFLLAGAGMMLALGAPAAADAKPGKGKPNAAKVHKNAKGDTDVNRNGVADWREQRLIDANGNGIADWREHFVDRNRDGIDDRRQSFSMGNKWGGAACPPGLAKKNPPCIPPGQVGRTFTVGQRYPTNFGYYPYSNIPDEVIDLYDLDDDDRYVYRNGTLYVVDPRTRIIERIITGLLGF